MNINIYQDVFGSDLTKVCGLYNNKSTKKANLKRDLINMYSAETHSIRGPIGVM